ncbi:MAG: TfoX/Sxy family protein [Acidipropionibacterium sp.]|nr:TfoX/Sxy family protein [Acidipropionibacterium sp.]
MDDVTSRKMMGEYMLYSCGRLFGGVYDDRFLIKVTKASRELLPDAELTSPYPGAKNMIVVDSENPETIAEVVHAMLPELPLTKRKK